MAVDHTTTREGTAMSDDSGKFLIATTIGGLWFAGQAVVFWVLWNFAVVPYFGFTELALIDAFAFPVALRLLFRSPKLSITFE